MHSSCVNCLPAAGPATGPLAGGLESESSLVPQHGPPGQPGEQEQGCVAKGSQAPGPPLFLPADGMGPAAGQKGTQGTSPVPTRPPSDPRKP